MMWTYIFCDEVAAHRAKYTYMHSFGLLELFFWTMPLVIYIFIILMNNSIYQNGKYSG